MIDICFIVFDNFILLVNKFLDPTLFKLLILYYGGARGAIVRNRKEWIRWAEFKSWTRLTACHIALEESMNPAILHPAMNEYSWVDSFNPGESNRSRRIQTHLTPLKILLVSHHVRGKGLGKYLYLVLKEDIKSFMNSSFELNQILSK